MKMQTRTWMCAMMLTVGVVGATRAWGPTAITQHGHATDPEAHFNELAERLALTAEQRESLSEPFHQAFAAMEELHRLHGVIAAQLTDEQKSELGEMIHKMLSSSFSEEHGQPHHGDRR